MQKNSEIRLISLTSIKTRSCLYPMLPFEFGIAVFEDTCFANNRVDVMIILASLSKGQYVFPPTER